MRWLRRRLGPPDPGALCDVLFARPDLDLEQQGAYGKPVIDGFRAKGDKRAELVRRAEACLAARRR